MLYVQIFLIVCIGLLLIYIMLLVRFLEKHFIVTSQRWVKVIIEIANMLAIVATTVLGMYELRDLVLVTPDIYLADTGNIMDDGKNIMAPARVEIDAPFYLDIYYSVEGTDPAKGELYHDNEGILLSNPAQVLACTKFLWLYSEPAERYFRVYDPETAAQYIELHSLELVETQTVKVGEKVRLEVFPEPENTSNVGYFWESDNTTVASVQGNGRTCIVTGHEPGVAAVKVAASQNREINALCFVTVVDLEQPVKSRDEIQAETVSTMPPTDRPNRERNTKGNKENDGKSGEGVSSAEAAQTEPQGSAKDVTPSTQVEIPAVRLAGIDVRTLPDVLLYRIGDRLDLEGLELTAYYDDGTEEVIHSGYQCSLRYFTMEGIQNITVFYGGQRTEFQVEVEADVEKEETTKETTEAVKPLLSHVHIQTPPERTVYEAGESLDTYGLSLTVFYDNGSEEIVRQGFQCSPVLLNEPGEQTITVTYQGMDAFFPVIVNEKKPSLSGISVEIENDLILEGSASQLNVTAYYTDGAQTDITDAATLKSENNQVAEVGKGGTVLGIKAGSTGISAEYGGFHAKASITVKGEDRISLNTDRIDGLSVWGETINISVTASGSWSADSDSPWVTFHPDKSEISGGAGENFLVLHIIMHENLSRGSTWDGTAFPERTAVLTFRCGDSTAVLYVTQKGYSRN